MPPKGTFCARILQFLDLIICAKCGITVWLSLVREITKAKQTRY